MVPPLDPAAHDYGPRKTAHVRKECLPTQTEDRAPSAKNRNKSRNFVPRIQKHAQHQGPTCSKRVRSVSISQLLPSARHLIAPIAFAAAAVMAPAAAVLVVPNPTTAPTIEKRLGNMVRIDALPVFLQLRNDLVVVIPYERSVSYEGFTRAVKAPSARMNLPLWSKL